jgi:hypothetical protein
MACAPAAVSPVFSVREIGPVRSISRSQSN